MSKKQKIEILSFQYKTSDGVIHSAVVQPAPPKAAKASKKAVAKTASESKVAYAKAAIESSIPAGPCNCGEERCVNNTKYRCMQDPFGDCVWWKTTEGC